MAFEEHTALNMSDGREVSTCRRTSPYVFCCSFFFFLVLLFFFLL